MISWWITQFVQQHKQRCSKEHMTIHVVSHEYLQHTVLSMDESPNSSCVNTLSILFRHTQMLAGRTFEISHSCLDDIAEQPHGTKEGYYSTNTSYPYSFIYSYQAKPNEARGITKSNVLVYVSTMWSCYCLLNMHYLHDIKASWAHG